MKPGWKDLASSVYQQLMQRTLYIGGGQCIVEEGLQPGSLRRGAPRPDNVTVVEEKENVGFKEEKKKRLRKKV